MRLTNYYQILHCTAIYDLGSPTLFNLTKDVREGYSLWTK